MNIHCESGHKKNSPSRRGSRNERGQVLSFVAIIMVIFFCMCGFVIDVGRIYIAYTQLVASTEAAALAGAQSLPSGPNAVSAATTYSSVSGDKNAYANLPGVTLVSANTLAECLTTLSNLGLGCSAASGIYNAIQVQQTVPVTMTFAQFFGQKSLPLVATATASAKGSPVPYNIAIIIDTTQSMGQSNSDSCTDPNPPGKSYTTRIQCALIGVKALLLDAAPCPASYTTCPSGGVNAIDMISIFTFPNAEANTTANDYSNGCGGPTTASTYSFPTAGATTYGPTGTAATYQITPFLNDFRTSQLSTTLNPASDLTLALGQVSTCTGMTAPGGLGTYYAGAVVAAQAALLQEQAVSGRTGAQNAIVLLSDGAANATKMATTNAAGGTVSKTASTYPSTINQCQQGIYAANLASTLANNGTTVYTVAYGASASSGCTTDTSGSNANIAPCTTLLDMATTAADFFSDYTAKGGDSGCTSALEPATGLATIFNEIYYNTTRSRLIPNGTT